MNLPESFSLQLAAYAAASTAEFRWRPILMRAVLDVSPPSVIRESMKAVEATYRPSDSTLKRMVTKTREKMELPPLPVSKTQGRTPAAFYDEYRQTYCAEWIRKNGGLPRMDQLLDPAWDLRPYLEPDGHTLEEAPATEHRIGSAGRGPEPSSNAQEKPKMATKRPRKAPPSLGSERGDEGKSDHKSPNLEETKDALHESQDNGKTSRPARGQSVEAITDDEIGEEKPAANQRRGIKLPDLGPEAFVAKPEAPLAIQINRPTTTSSP
ncbi:MAG: hypothetical protein QM627_05170 [Luteolibacter sp.]